MKKSNVEKPYIQLWPYKPIRRNYAQNQNLKEKYSTVFQVFLNSQIYYETPYISLFNIYKAYVDHLKILNTQRDLSSLIHIEKHHVIPLFASSAKRGSIDEGELISVTVLEHNRCHLYRLFTFNEIGDYFTLNMRCCDDENLIKKRLSFAASLSGKLNTLAQQKQRLQFLKRHPENINPSVGGSVGSEKQKKSFTPIRQNFWKKNWNQ
jgi:hypothetical protein